MEIIKDVSVFTCIAASDFLVAGTKHGEVYKFDTTVSLFGKLKKAVTCVAASPRYIAAGTHMRIQIWTNTGEHYWSSGTRGWVLGLVFTGTTLFSCGKDLSVQVYEVPDKTRAERLHGHNDDPVGISAYKSTLVTAGQDSTLRLWKHTQEKQSIFPCDGKMECICVVSETQFIAGDSEGRLSYYKTTLKKPFIQTLPGQHGYCELIKGNRWITALCVKKGTIYSGSWDGSVRVWKVAQKSLLQVEVLSVPGVVNGITIYNDEVYAVVGTEHRLGRWFSVEGFNGVLKIK